MERLDIDTFFGVPAPYGFYIEREEDYTPDHVEAAPVSWFVGQAHYIEEQDGFILIPEAVTSSLPCEFWNHQLLEIDINNNNSLVEFIGKWGIPYHMGRNDKLANKKMLNEYGINETEANFIECYYPKLKDSQIINSLFAVCDPFSKPIFGISKKELRASLLILKEAVAYLVYGCRVDDEATLIDTINHATSSPHNITSCKTSGLVSCSEFDTTLQGRGLLTSAILNQLINSFTDEAPWRMCACVGCGRIFKRKQPEKLNIIPDSDSKYCCTKCKNRQSQRNHREAAKNRIRH